MKRIRIGNDFVFNWAIERGGLPEDLSSVLESKLTASVFDKKQDIPFTISGNIITVEFTPEICNVIGSYNLLFTYILPDTGLSDEERKCAVDVDAFQIVAKTAQADDSTEFSMTSDMAIAFKGDKGEKGDKGDKGDSFTYSDFTPEQIEELKQPAIDAAQQADTARTELTTAVNTKLGEADAKIEEMDATLSLYDGRVTQVESDIAQLAGEVKELGIKDAVQGAKIKDIENVINTMNPNQSAQLSVSGVSPLSLPKNAANSGMSVKMEGLTQDVGGVITHFEPTGRIRVEDASENDVSRFYLTAPELRSNGTVKDEIRKGANGYELVKRVGSSLYGSENMSNSGASGTTDWVDSNADGLADGWFKLTSPIGVCSIVTGNGFTGNAQRYEADATTTYQGIYFPLAFIGSAAIGKTFKLKFKYRSSSALVNSRGEGMVISAPTNTGNAVWYETIWRPTAAMDTGLLPHLRLIIRSSNWAEIDEVSLREIPSADGLIAPTSTFTELSDETVLYTLATPVITPISYGGILNSAENGTVYHEPVVADAGVYDTKMDILLTDYPIATIEEIIVHKDGIDTYLDVSTAVIAGDKLSFTHPSLVSGDLVLFTYSFAKESTNGNITATFYDSNVVKIDTVTGKAYKIEDVVTNGVLTRTLTEV